MLFPSVGGYMLKNTEAIRRLFPSVGGYMSKNTEATIWFILFAHQFSDLTMAAIWYSGPILIKLN